MKKTAGIEAVITEEEEIYEEKSGFQKWGKIGLYALCGFLFSLRYVTVFCSLCGFNTV